MDYTDEYYSGIAAGYDELHGKEQDEKLTEFLERIAIPGGAALLDVGCGTGRSKAMLAGVDWHGIDPSQGLIAHAHPDAAPRITLAAAEDIPFPDERFDIILSLTALQNFSDAERGLQEMARVAKPDAPILISFLRKSGKAEQLDTAIKSVFHVEEEWTQSKDRMYVARKRQSSTAPRSGTPSKRI